MTFLFVTLIILEGLFEIIYDQCIKICIGKVKCILQWFSFMEFEINKHAKLI